MMKDLASDARNPPSGPRCAVPGGLAVLRPYCDCDAFHLLLTYKCNLGLESHLDAQPVAS
jgi:hypothetical protein